MRGRYPTPIDYQPLTNPPSIFPSMALSQPPDYQHPFQNAPHLSSPTSANSQPAISPLFACQCVPLQLAAYVFATFRLLRRHSVTRSLRFRPFLLAPPSFGNSQPTFSAFVRLATRPKAGRQAVRAELWSAGADRVTRWTTQSSLPSRRKTFSGSPGR